MIETLGKKRVFILGALLVINALLGAIVFMYLVPQEQSTQKSLRSLNSQISTVQTDLTNLRIDFDELEKQRSTYERLVQRGFLNGQDRRAAVRDLEDLDERSGLIFSKISIGGGEIDEHPEALKAEHVVLSSPISVTLEAMDDVDVFNYIHLLSNVFPGHISVDEMVIKREIDVSGDVLRAIASGEEPKMVEGRLELTWRTMMPKSLAVGQSGGGL